MFYNILINFSVRFSPRAAGRRRHAHCPRWLPVGSPPLGDFFFEKWSKLYILILKSLFHVFLMGFLNEICHKILKKTWKFIFSIRFDEKINYEKNIFFLSKKMFFLSKKYFFHNTKKYCFFVQKYSKIIGNDEILNSRSKIYNNISYIIHISWEI